MGPIVEQSDPDGQQIAAVEESIDMQVSVELQQKLPGNLESTDAQEVGLPFGQVLALA